MQPEKSPVSILLFLMGGIIVILGQSLKDARPDITLSPILILVAVGIGLVFFGIWTFERGLPKWLTNGFAWAARHSIKKWQLCMLVISLPISAIVPYAAESQQKMLNPYLALLAWFMAIGLVLAGGWIQVSPLRWPSWRLVALVLGLTIVAFIVRFICVDRIPITLTGDEAAAGIAAEDFTHGLWNNIFITGWYAFPSFFFTIPAIFIGFLGHTTEALRLPSALAGALTVTASFFVARAMFGKRAAWFTAIFLASLHFHIHFSRIGLNNIWDGLWYVITIGAFWYGWEKDRRNAYLLAGLSLGLSQYFYSSSRTILMLILGWVVLAALFDRPRLKRAWVDLLIMILVAAVVAFPLIWHYIKFPNTFMEPMNRVALTSAWLRQESLITRLPAWRIVLKQVGLALGSFTNEPLRAWYMPNVPLLRPFAAGLFLIGLVLLLLRRGKWHIFPILLWLAAFMAIGGLSESTPAAQRFVAAAPVCAIVVGFSLSESSALLENYFEKGKRLIAAASVLLVALLAVGELYFYFEIYTPYSLISNAHSNDVVAQTLANYLETKPAHTEVFFFGSPNMGYNSIPSIDYLVPRITGINIDQPWTSAAKPALTKDRLIFVFLPDHSDQVPSVLSDYPDGKLKSIPAADGQLLYTIYEVAPSQP
jgi:4-amino-4-deoxy-L-arabinose transferase-like glycosyltransferase